MSTTQTTCATLSRSAHDNVIAATLVRFSQQLADIHARCRVNGYGGAASERSAAAAESAAPTGMALGR
jgi:hypothetical protein